MLTHTQVTASLEQIAGIKARPDSISDTPEYWMLFMPQKKSSLDRLIGWIPFLGSTPTGVYSGTLYNTDHTICSIPDCRSTIHARVEREDPTTCNISQTELNLLASALLELTEGNVYVDNRKYVPPG